jgi:hypothetical protein
MGPDPLVVTVRSPVACGSHGQEAGVRQGPGRAPAEPGAQGPADPTERRRRLGAEGCQHGQAEGDGHREVTEGQRQDRQRGDHGP